MECGEVCESGAVLSACPVYEVPRDCRSTHWVRLFLDFLTRQLYRLAFTGDSLKVMPHLHTNVLEKDSSLVFSGEQELRQFKLYFAGTVSMTRGSANARPLCTIKMNESMSVTAWVSSERVSSLSSDCCVPAWLVKRVKEGSQHIPTMELDHDHVDVQLPDHLLVQGTPSHVTLRAPYLKLRAGVEGSVALTRLQDPTETSTNSDKKRRKGDITDALGGSGAIAAATRAASSSQDHTTRNSQAKAKIDTSARHLLS